MLLVPGGEFWAGRERAGGNDEEHPRYRSRVHDFCLDRTEVTATAYEACVAQRSCSSALRETKSCNAGRERADHPINCVDWQQANAFCAARGARLPTELEWEYAARGGSEYRRYSWGNDAPDGNTCWKKGATCPVASHTVGAFGLHDMNGNVWEWTDSWFSPYPWPASSGSTKVYRGGSFSRRFEKWLSLTLRNRSAPDQFGSHLGFRCAALSSTPCPYGQDGERCLHGVETAECAAGQAWNGVRCARPGEAGCAADEQQVTGHGCVGATPTARTHKGATATPGDETSSAEVTARHDARFDADCARFNPTRPQSWLFEGGSHAARNQAGRQRGCKNRDVGVGWNSTCCP